MAKTFKLQNPKYPYGKNFSDRGYIIEINPVEDSSSVDIALRAKYDFTIIIDDHEFIFNEKKIITVRINSINNPVQLDDIVQTNTEIIYQTSISMNSLRSGDNLFEVLGEHNEADEDTGEITKVRELVLASFSGFIEADEVPRIRLERAGIEDTEDKRLWKAIQKSPLDFNKYVDFIDWILGNDDGANPVNGNLPPDIPHNGRYFADGKRKKSKTRSPFIASEEYNLLKFATEFFMLAKFGLDTQQLQGYLNPSHRLPYYDYIVGKIKEELHLTNTTSPFIPLPGDDSERRTQQRLENPFLVELIWSYWMEQGMLMQTMNLINMRFQNIKGPRAVEPLMRFDADPLRPLSHILWGSIQDEQHRLSLTRRVYEYDHEYGLSLTGKAVPEIRTADSRVKFLEAFHNLLNCCILYYHEADNTTVIADAFPILNNLREVHLLLAEGNHNAYGNLTWTARQEMMMTQYILSRPEMREFLGGRTMVPYPETWMDRVETMRNVQGWGNGILNFYELAVHGEQILLSIRYGNWSDVSLSSAHASNWALSFRNSIQRYVHAYRVVSGIDLSALRLQEVSNYAVQPALLINKRFGRDMPLVRPKMLVRRSTF